MASKTSSNNFSSTSSKAAAFAADDVAPEFPVRDARLADLMAALDAAIEDTQQKADKNPTQKKYADTIFRELASSGWTALSSRLNTMCSENIEAPFARATVLSALGALQRLQKGEFDPTYHASKYELYQTDVSDLRLRQIIKLIRLVVCEIVYRFYRTYDPNETRYDNDTKKDVVLMKAQNATYLVNGHKIADEEFFVFMDELLKAYNAMLNIDFEHLNKVFADAGALAKKESDEFFVKIEAEKAAKKRDSRQKAGISSGQASPKTAPKSTSTPKSAPVGQLKVVAVRAAAVLLPTPVVNPWKKRADDVAAAAVATPEPEPQVQAENGADVGQGQDSTFTIVKRAGVRGRGRSRGVRVARA